MEQHDLKNVNVEVFGGQSSNPYLNVVHFLNNRADVGSCQARPASVGLLREVSYNRL
jgi:hypothetical protein